MTDEPIDPKPPIRYDDHILAAGLALARDEWPGHRQMTGTLTVHTRDAAGFCTHCRMGHRIVNYPCQPVRLAVRTFAADLAELILDNL